MKGLRLYKREKLCSKTAIDQLFSRAQGSESAIKYPLRAVWRVNSRRHSDAPIAFVVSVPKKRLRHAVDRVAMRRRIREAYRLNRLDYPLSPGTKVDLAFIYVANDLKPYGSVENAVKTLLDKIRGEVESLNQTQNDVI